MLPSRRCRRVRPIVAVAIIATYVGSFAALPWFAGRGIVASRTVERITRTIHLPLLLYQQDSLPGARRLSSIRNRWYWIGTAQRFEENDANSRQQCSD